MGNSEHHRRNNYCHMHVAKPSLQNLLKRATEEKLLTNGRHQSHNKQLEQQVAREVRESNFSVSCLDCLATVERKYSQCPEVPLLVPLCKPIVEWDQQ